MARGSAVTPSRLKDWPDQGEHVRMAEAPLPWLMPFVGWRFQVVRRSPLRRWIVRLRASYEHTIGGPALELSLDTWNQRDWQRYFEECP